MDEWNQVRSLTKGTLLVGLSDIDRGLLQRCLERRPGAWEDFVDRFLGLVVHVVRHTAQSRSIRVAAADVDDLVSDVFMAIIDDDFAVLRRFRGEANLATYLTVVARRIVVRELLKRRGTLSLQEVAQQTEQPAARGETIERRISDREQVERLLRQLKAPEADVVRMYHLEGKTYQEISASTGIPENSVGPTLTRARAKLRRANLVD